MLDEQPYKKSLSKPSIWYKKKKKMNVKLLKEPFEWPSGGSEDSTGSIFSRPNKRLTHMANQNPTNVTVDAFSLLLAAPAPISYTKT